MTRNGWTETKLGEVVELKRGYDLPKKNRETGSVPIISSSGLSGMHNEAKVKGPGVVTGRYGTIGEVHWVDEDYWPLNTALYVRNFNGNDRRYIYYFLKTIDYFRYSDKAAVPGVNRNHLHRAKVIVPPLVEQKAIAEILGALDAKIGLNRRMNETLESLARALFKSWFVDFDPVRAKMDGRQPPGLSPEIAALFPDSFEHQKGELIPTGWTRSAVSEVMHVNPSRRLAKRQSAPYLDMKNMPTQGHHPDGWIQREFNSGTRFINGDTLLARITPCLENGKTAFVDFLGDGEIGWGSTEYIVLRPCPPLPAEFGYYLARSDELRLHAIKNMTGSSGRQRVPPNCLDQYFIAVPSRRIAETFGGIARPMMTRIKSNCDEARTLGALRDALLPRLLSGDLRVPDTERFATNTLRPRVSDAEIAETRHGQSANPRCQVAQTSCAPRTTSARQLNADTVVAATHVEVDDDPAATADSDDIATERLDISDFETDDVMAAFRQAVRNRGTVTRDELLKDVSVRLGFQRLGSTIEHTLRGHLRAAIRRRIIGSDGLYDVFAATPSMSDYSRDELVDVLRSVIHSGTTVTRDEAIQAVARHLGFTRIRNTVAAPIRSAINGAIRRGVLNYEGDVLWRAD